RCTLRPNTWVSTTDTVEVERRGRLNWMAISLPETRVAGVTKDTGTRLAKPGLSSGWPRRVNQSSNADLLPEGKVVKAKSSWLELLPRIRPRKMLARDSEDAWLSPI